MSEELVRLMRLIAEDETRKRGQADGDSYHAPKSACPVTEQKKETKT